MQPPSSMFLNTEEISKNHVSPPHTQLQNHKWLPAVQRHSPGFKLYTAPVVDTLLYALNPACLMNQSLLKNKTLQIY